MGFLIPTLLPGESDDSNRDIDNNNSSPSTSASTNTFNQLVMYQTADGNFKFSSSFAKEVLSISFQQLNSSLPSSLLPILDDQQDEAGESEILSVWSTLLALEYLEKNYKDVQDRWELMSKKAKEWLNKILSREGKGYKDLKLEELTKEAQQLLTKASNK